MADIGKEKRVIEVEPKRHIEELPERSTPTPEKVPDREPVPV